MKNNTILGILIAVLFLSAVGTLLLSGVSFIAHRQLENLQLRDINMRSTLDAAQKLANESIAYSRKNPAITSVLTNFSQARRIPLPPPPVALTNQPPIEADPPAGQ